MDDLKKLRDRIDWLDSQIASLLNERMKAADQVGRVKRQSQQEVTDSSREETVLHHVETLVQHPVLKANIANIYREIMQESRTAQRFFQDLSQPFRRIGIIGLGLMGGSICKCLKTKDASVEIGTLHRLTEDIALAQEGGWVDTVYLTMAELVKNSDIMIIASPISTVTQIASEISQCAVPYRKLVVMDIASVKEEIVETFEMLSNENIEFICTHPMSGKETRGFANSQATLFVNRPWIIVPNQKNSASGIDSIRELLHYLGSNVSCLEAKIHDQQAALVSHIPWMLSKSYLDFVSSIAPESLKISGPGFEGFTRLALSNGEMCAEIAEYNKDVICSYMDQWLNYLISTRRP